MSDRKSRLHVPDALRLNRRDLMSRAAIATTATALAGCGGSDGAGQTGTPPDLPGTIDRPGTIALPPAESSFVLKSERAAITSLRYRQDRVDTDYIRAGTTLGPVYARWRSAGGNWASLDTASAPGIQDTRSMTVTASDGTASLTSSFAIDGNELIWRVSVRNQGSATIEVGDLLLPMPMNTDFSSGKPVTASVLKHSFVSGHGSHVFWMRANSVGPYLLLLPDQTTQLQYWEVRSLAAGAPGQWCAFIHADASEAEARAGGTRWRQPVTSLTLRGGEEKQYSLRFQWVADYEQARAAIADRGLIDVDVAPGMTVPRDLHVDIALRSSRRVAAIEAEFPSTTTITPLPDNAGRQLYRVRFTRLGENRLTLVQDGDRRTHLEFFATEPLETMIAKRAAFIARRQHRDPEKWYDGLFGEWNMETGTLLGPDNYDRITGWRIYEVTCDDPGLSKPAFLAIKNAEHPVPAEVEALDRYIERFVWGGLQRKDTEEHAFGIYGIPDWKQNRESADAGPNGRLHIWRPFDYPHIFAMYLSMHRIARDHPSVPTLLDARTYLMRAYGTALGMFTIPMRISGWSAYHTGFYNECVLPELMVALRQAGLNAEAATLQGHWATKIQNFTRSDADLFGSEYPFDSTGFESTQALARSAVDDPAAAGISRDAAVAFRDRQIAANLFCRGWLEPAYYYLGSDYRQTAGNAYVLTYMAQMGGWAILDYALNDASDPHPLLRLGYASQLSSWALLNSGGAADGHGYWYPGEANDGGAGGGFEPAPRGKTWLDQPHHRGSWYYSCEIDLGFCGAIRAARTIVADDPIFGRVCYGGRLGPDGPEIAVEPADGVRRRLSVRIAAGSCDVTLENARFAQGQRIRIAADLSSIGFGVEPYDNSVDLRVTLRRNGGAWRTVRVPSTNGPSTNGPSTNGELTLPLS